MGDGFTIKQTGMRISIEYGFPKYIVHYDYEKGVTVMEYYDDGTYKLLQGEELEKFLEEHEGDE